MLSPTVTLGLRSDDHTIFSLTLVLCLSLYLFHLLFNDDAMIPLSDYIRVYEMKTGNSPKCVLVITAISISILQKIVSEKGKEYTNQNPQKYEIDIHGSEINNRHTVYSLMVFGSTNAYK
ncbi:hypothetical protein Hanom_Chr09g00796131 [Helianthus anomalus]